MEHLVDEKRFRESLSSEFLAPVILNLFPGARSAININFFLVFQSFSPRKVNGETDMKRILLCYNKSWMLTPLPVYGTSNI
jgi:hypothetical protein